MNKHLPLCADSNPIGKAIEMALREKQRHTFAQDKLMYLRTVGTERNVDLFKAYDYGNLEIKPLSERVLVVVPEADIAYASARFLCAGRQVSEYRITLSDAFRVADQAIAFLKENKVPVL